MKDENIPFPDIKKTINIILLIILAASYNFLVYSCGRLLSGGFYHRNLSTGLDAAIPFIPWTILIYWGCVVFWGINYYLGIRYDKYGGRGFLAAHFIGETICFFFFVFFPTTMDRPVIGDAEGLLSVIATTYRVDSPDNLLPSIHCFISYLCWIGIRGNRNIPKWYRILSFIIAIAVCISTLTVKQHVIADVITGILLAELSFFISSRFFQRRKAG
ncbi:MAG: phosphatidic acid phosphatase [Lachnospiraceae bacterium]|nr:phosphatidic acid phosphatase [Lachnospiraceae bacterium]